MIQFITLIFLGISVLITSKITKDPVNPSNIIIFSFFLPLVLSSMRLSDLQSQNWMVETYIVYFQILMLWFFVPLIYIIFFNKRKTSKIENFRFYSIGIISRIYALIFILLYLAENKIIMNSFLFNKANISLLANSGHTTSLPLISIFTSNAVVAIFLLLINIKKKSNIIDVILIIVICIIPTTRLARIDIFISLIVIFIVFLRWFGDKINYYKIILVSIVILMTLSFVGNYRMTHGNAYSIKYSEEIKFNKYSGPNDIFAIYYGYFPLSFENVDRLIRKNQSIDNFYGLITSRVIFGTIQFDNLIKDYPMYDYVNKFMNPVSGAANVSTCLGEFWLDFGTYFIWIPLLFYITLYLYFYHYSFNNIYYFIIYTMFSYAFALSSFQNLLIEPILIYSILLVIILVKLSKYRFSIR